MSLTALNHQLTWQQVRIRNGFLNNIPGGDALLTERPASGVTFNLVSSHWLDWKNFTLHQTDVTRTPSLRLTSGETVKCHGYISGTWTENGTLSQQWTGLQFFVVDCEFSRTGYDKRLHFVMNSTKLSMHNLHCSKEICTIAVSWAILLTYTVTGPEKRFFCGRLNLRLFRHAPPVMMLSGCSWKRTPIKKPEGPFPLHSFAVPKMLCLSVADSSLASQVKDTFWAEMNRREKWDRDFEKRLRDASENTFTSRRRKDKDADQGTADLEKEKADEEAVRIEWDINQGKTLQALESLKI